MCLRDPCQVRTGLSLCLQLPRYLLDDIFNRLEEADLIAIAQCVCKDFLDSGNSVRSLRFIVRYAYHERARNINLSSLRSRISKVDGGGASSSQDIQVEIPHLRFKDYVVLNLKKKRNLVQLRIEVEPSLQAKSVPDDEKRRTDFWISDPYFLGKWLPVMKFTLEHLCIVDYGQQAIMRRSSIIQILSEYCEYLFHSLLQIVQVHVFVFFFLTFELLVLFSSPCHKFK